MKTEHFKIGSENNYKFFWLCIAQESNLNLKSQDKKKTIVKQIVESKFLNSTNKSRLFSNYSSAGFVC